MAPVRFRADLEEVALPAGTSLYLKVLRVSFVRASGRDGQVLAFALPLALMDRSRGALRMQPVIDLATLMMIGGVVLALRRLFRSSGS